MCFYNALSFLKRLPTIEEIGEPDKKIDLLAGYRMKDSFIELKNNDNSKCQSDLQNLYEEQIDGRVLDGLLPFQEKYIGNSYIDVYKYFCKPKPDVKSVKQMYTVGLELQQKLDKIIDYDRCNPDTAKTMGIKEYCKDLFKDQ